MTRWCGMVASGAQRLGPGFAMGSAVAVFVFVAVVGAPPARAQGIADWPCQQPHVASLSAETIWPGPPPKVAGNWRDDLAVRRVVETATNPENVPQLGQAAIDDLAREAGGDRPRKLALALAGILGEVNDLRQILFVGLRQNITTARVLASVVAENDAALGAVPDDGAPANSKRRKEISEARFRNYRSQDNAEDGAKFICRRLEYLDRKAGLLIGRIKLHYDTR
jgi:hypothetical protein